MEPTDAECIRQCLSGATEAFAAIVKRHQKAACVSAYACVRDEHLANDLAQEAFLKAFRSLKRLRNPEYFGTWFHGIVKSVCIDWIRKTKGRGSNPTRRRRPAVVSLENLPDPPAASKHGERLKDPSLSTSESPPARLDRHALRKMVLEKINSLPTAYREIMLLKHIRGHSYADIEKMLKLSHSAVETKLFRARQALKEKLRPLFPLLEQF